MRRLVLATAVTVAGLLTMTAAPATAAPATRALFTLHDPRLDEVSGIGVGITSPGVDYVANDSGDSPRFFALDGTDGDVLGEYRVPGATNVDWEDLAVARDARGVPSVWLADIGDNEAVRDSITVYRVDEPHVQPGHPLGVTTSAAPQTWRLRYPDGMRNAESLAVAPGGTAYVITKEAKGVVGVYRLPASPGTGVQTLTEVTTLGVPAAVPVEPALLVTGAAISADGRQLVIRTYLAAYVWPIEGDAVDVALALPPTVVPLPIQPAGEAVTFTPDGGALLIASENVNSTVYEVFLPGGVPSSPAASSAPSGVQTVTLYTTASPQHRVWPWVLLVAAVALAAIVLVIRRKRAAPGRINP